MIPDQYEYVTPSYRTKAWGYTHSFWVELPDILQSFFHLNCNQNMNNIRSEWHDWAWVWSTFWVLYNGPDEVYKRHWTTRRKQRSSYHKAMSINFIKGTSEYLCNQILLYWACWATDIESNKPYHLIWNMHDNTFNQPLCHELLQFFNVAIWSTALWVTIM